jgi:hypothetical protein
MPGERETHCNLPWSIYAIADALPEVWSNAPGGCRD